MKKREHQRDTWCWCEPAVIDYVDGSRLIQHRPDPTHTLPTGDTFEQEGDV